MANDNALTVSYQTSYGMVELSPQIVTQYLKRGNAELTDQEIRLFIELCKFQKLNPFIGEAYAIKFGTEFSMVVGYDTYKRRAEENPEYCGRKSGIVVQRGEQIVQKEGTCIYPGEKLIGGWCRVFRQLPNGRTDETFKEVGLEEYDKHQANWKTKPATMIEKVAVSQALRNAFPKDFTGLYTAEEGGRDESEVTAAAPLNVGSDVVVTGEEEDRGARLVTKEERNDLFNRAVTAFGPSGSETLKGMIEALGYSDTKSLTYRDYLKLTMEIAKAVAAMNEEEAAAAENIN